VVGHAAEGSNARRCAFCHNAIAPGAPPEHVIPQWISRAYPDAMFVRTNRQGQQVRSKVIGITVDTVCKDCNHHWMSDLETWASPMLKPMLKGNRQALTVEQQATLAQWGTKTAMTLDQVYPPEERVWSPEVCKDLMVRKLPPPGVGVHLAHYTGDGDFLKTVHNDLYMRPVPPGTRPGPPDGHRTAIRLDRLIVEVHRTQDPLRLSIGKANQPRVTLSDILLPIWPTVESTSWPPRLTFSEPTWDSFVEPNLPDAPENPWGNDE
jgi:hypothetical protein